MRISCSGFTTAVQYFRNSHIAIVVPVIFYSIHFKYTDGERTKLTAKQKGYLNKG